MPLLASDFLNFFTLALDAAHCYAVPLWEKGTHCSQPLAHSSASKLQDRKPAGAAMLFPS